jgi:hypothetical protein
MNEVLLNVIIIIRSIHGNPTNFLESIFFLIFLFLKCGQLIENTFDEKNKTLSIENLGFWAGLPNPKFRNQ